LGEMDLRLLAASLGRSADRFLSPKPGWQERKHFAVTADLSITWALRDSSASKFSVTFGRGDSMNGSRDSRVFRSRNLGAESAPDQRLSENCWSGI